MSLRIKKTSKEDFSMARINPAMMRAKTALELTTELYARRMSELGNVVNISIETPKKETQLLSFKIGVNGERMGGMKAPIEVGQRRADVAYVNPLAIVNMAYLGRGFYKARLPLRVLAVFPSWDRIAFVVSKDLGLKSLGDIATRKIPLKLSTRAAGVNNTTYYTLSKILSFYGLSFAKIKRWGGELQECVRPSAPERIRGIRQRTLCAIFDEGINRKDGWLTESLRNGYDILPLEPEVVTKMERLGYMRALIPKARYPRLKQDIVTIDFSGWPLFTHRWLPDGIAYSICESIEARRDTIACDQGPVDLKMLCKSTDGGPLQIPLHPGAVKFYKDKNYL